MAVVTASLTDGVFPSAYGTIDYAAFALQAQQDFNSINLDSSSIHLDTPTPTQVGFSFPGGHGLFNGTFTNSFITITSGGIALDTGTGITFTGVLSGSSF